MEIARLRDAVKLVRSHRGESDPSCTDLLRSSPGHRPRGRRRDGSGVRFHASARDPTAIAVTPDGQRIFVSHTDRDGLTVLDAATLGHRGDDPMDRPQEITITPDGLTAYISVPGEDLLRVLSLASLEVVESPRRRHAERSGDRRQPVIEGPVPAFRAWRPAPPS